MALPISRLSVSTLRALAISAAYELIEWAAAIWLGQGADEFLGTQGDPWDTQSDMGFALIGSLTTIFGLSRWHDTQLRQITSHDGRTADGPR